MFEVNGAIQLLCEKKGNKHSTKVHGEQVYEVQVKD